MFCGSGSRRAGPSSPSRSVPYSDDGMVETPNPRRGIPYTRGIPVIALTALAMVGDPRKRNRRGLTASTTPSRSSCPEKMEALLSRTKCPERLRRRAPQTGSRFSIIILNRFPASNLDTFGVGMLKLISLAGKVGAGPVSSYGEAMASDIVEPHGEGMTLHLTSICRKEGRF